MKGSSMFYQVKLKLLLPMGFYDKHYLNCPLEDGWQSRLQDVIMCPDNKLIVRHQYAGKVRNGKQFMHNGIITTLGGYYGEAIVKMLHQNRGVHEPQEEYAFKLVLNEMPEGATMLELGSYWAFYSIWFNKRVKGARNFMVEPELFNLKYGINNFRLNKVQGTFTNAFAGSESGKLDGKPVICVDDYLTAQHIDFLDILHSDIQGFEYDMLLGASKAIKEKKIGYAFISTHGNKVHYQCLDFLIANDFTIICQADEKDTYSADGIIVARSNHIVGIEKIDISLKSKESVA